MWQGIRRGWLFSILCWKKLVDVPEREDRENFAEFFFEIFEAKEDEYIEAIL